jgi:hypothetical protein
VEAVVVAPIAVDAVEDEVKIILYLPMQQREVCVPILAQMYLTMVKSLQQTKCVPHGKSLYSVGTNYGQDINNELQNKVWVILTEPVHTNDVLARHSVREVMIRNGQLNIQQAQQAQETILKATVQAGTYMDAPMKLAILQNEIAQGEFAAIIEVPVVLTDSEETQFSNDWRTF